MDAINNNSFKASSKVSLLQESPSSSKPTKKQPLITFFISLTLTIITLTFIFYATISIRVQLRPSQPPEFPSLLADPVSATRFVCSFTPYPHSCFTSISSINTPPDPETEPTLLFSLCLLAATNELANLTVLPKTLSSKSNDSRTQSALQTCASLFDDALGRLNGSVALTRVEPAVRMKISEMEAWMGGAVADQERCLEGLEEVGSAVVDEVRAKVQSSREYMSNSLAIRSNIDPIFDSFYFRPIVDETVGLTSEFVCSLFIFSMQFVICIFLFCLLFRM